MKSFILILINLAVCIYSNAQNWIMDVQIEGRVECYNSNLHFNNQITAVFGSVSRSAGNNKSQPEVSHLNFQIVNAPAGFSGFFGDLIVTGGGDCWPPNNIGSPGGGDASGSLNISYGVSEGGRCKRFYANYSDVSYTLIVDVTIYRPLEIPTVDSSICGSLYLIEASGADSYQWSVSIDGGNNYTVLSGKTTSTIALNISDVNGYSGTNLFVKVQDPSCYLRGNPRSIGFLLSAPPPNATFSKVNMSCYKGEDAKININISPSVANLNHFYIKGYHESNSIGNPPDVQIPDATGTSFQISKANLAGQIPRILPGKWTFVIANNQSPYGECEGTFTHNISINRDLEITEPPEFKITSAIPTNVSCNSLDTGNKSDGSVSLTIQNGIAPYYFLRTENGGTSQLGTTPNDRYISTPVINGLERKNYTFIAQYVVGSVVCSSPPTATISVGEPPNRITAINDSYTNVKCKNGNNGSSINITPTGGNAGYSYSWSGPRSFSSADQDISSLYAGTYALTVTDSKHCSDSRFSQLIIEPPNALEVFGAPSTNGNYNVTCLGNDGKIDLSYENKDFAISSFEWRRNGSLIAPSNNEHLTSLIPGLYSVKVTDTNQCSANTIINLSANPGISGNVVANSNYNGFSTKCNLSGEGTATVTINNGYGALQYQWKNNGTVIPDAINRTIFNLKKGIYRVKVTDANHCVYENDVTITSPSKIKPQLQLVAGGQISCPDGSDGKIKAVPVNGFGSYHYLWDHDTDISDSFADGLARGIYKITVEDDYGCSARDSVEIVDPPKMRFLFDKKDYNGSDLSCFGKSDGEVNLTVLNGQGAASSFKYLWSNNATTKDVTSLSQGDYTIRVTDGKLCTKDSVVNITGPQALTILPRHMSSFNGFDISCYGEHDGKVRIEALGGTGAYTYFLENEETSSVIEGLDAETYSVKVMDVNGCIKSGEIILTEPGQFSATSILVNPVSCFGYSDGVASVQGKGGIAPYEYSMDQVLWKNSNSFNGLSAGSKAFFLKDANACTAIAQQNVLQPEELQISFGNRVDAVCNASEGSVQTFVTGGNGGYNYSWLDEPGNQFMNAGDKLVNAVAGLYRVNVSDSKNCAISDITYISSIGGPTFNLHDINPVTCFGYDDGSASLSVYEAIPPFNISWSSGQKTESAFKLKAGNYFATVEDGLGCKSIKQVTIATPATIKTNFLKSQPLCSGDGNGAIEATVSGGISPYQLKWDNLNNTTNHASNLHAGIYALNIEDAHHCKVRVETELYNPEVLQISGFIAQPTCLGRCDGKISARVKGGTGIYSFQWEDGTLDSEITGKCPGDYSVKIKDTNACEADHTFNMPKGNPLEIDLGSVATVCVGQSKIVNAGTQWTEVNWTSSVGFSSTDNRITITNPGSYFFKGVDRRSCIALDTFKLETSLDLLKSEFLMPATAVLGDTLVAVDVTWPLPEKVEWSYPSSFKPITSSNNGILYTKLTEAGTFSVGMESFLAECRDLKEKTIIVSNTDQEEDNGGRLGFEELIQEFSLSPNPNNGHFSVKVILSDAKEINLRVVQFPVGVVINNSSFQSSVDHRINFSLEDIPQGMYVVLLNVDSQQRFIRFFKE